MNIKDQKEELELDIKRSEVAIKEWEEIEKFNDINIYKPEERERDWIKSNIDVIHELNSLMNSITIISQEKGTYEEVRLVRTYQGEDRDLIRKKLLDYVRNL